MFIFNLSNIHTFSQKNEEAGQGSREVLWGVAEGADIA